MKLQFAFLAFLLTFLIPSGQCGDSKTYSLPDCPDGACIKVFDHISNLTSGVPKKKLPFIDEEHGIIDLKPYLQYLGIKFPEKGYAWYFVKEGILIAATTQDNQDLISAVVDS